MLCIYPALLLHRAFLKSFLHWLYNKQSDFLEFVTVSWNPLRLVNLQRWEAWEGNGATADKAPRKINGGEQKKQIRVLGDACLQAGQGDENQPISK